MSQEQKLLPVEEEPKLLDRPAEERLREELDARNHADGVKPAGGEALRPPQPKGTQPKDSQPEPEKAHSSRKGLLLVVLVALVLIAIVFIVGLLPRLSRNKATEKAAEQQANMIPAVDVSKVKRSPEISRLLLPGNTTPLTEAPIYSRATGYVTKRYVDIGDRVHKNQLMAVIDAPDLDQQVFQGRAGVSQARQQLGQSEAALQQAESQLQLAKVTWERYAQLVTRGAVARQDADTQKSNYESQSAAVNSAKANVRAAQDNVGAAQANLDRLIALQSFKEVRAPFDGVVTSRNVDVGTYVSTNGGQSGLTTYDQTVALGSNSNSMATNGALFMVAQNNRLRILINVPQSDAPNVTVGQDADVVVTNYPGRRFPGKVTRTSNSLDPSTRTLLVEVQVDNRAGALFPGMYANVQFSSVRTSPPILVPGDSLITRANGTFVAILTAPDQQEREKIQKENPEISGESAHHEEPKKIHLVRVDIGRDFGTDTEITQGLQGWEYVVSNPSDQVYEGALVLPAKPQSPGSSGAAAGGPNDKQSGTTTGADTSAGGTPSGKGSGTGSSSGPKR